MREANNIRALEQIKPDWMGFICWEGSKRNVSQKPEYLPTTTERVGVFVNPDINTVVKYTKMLQLNKIQLHGFETPQFCIEVKQKTELQVIKAISIESENDIEETKKYEDVADFFLFDTKCKSIGGSGTQYDWNILQSYKGKVPFILSGGIGPKDYLSIISFKHPNFIGIDINSKFEERAAYKNIDIINKFINIIRHESNK